HTLTHSHTHTHTHTQNRGLHIPCLTCPIVPLRWQYSSRYHGSYGDQHPLPHQCERLHWPPPAGQWTDPCCSGLHQRHTPLHILTHTHTHTRSDTYTLSHT